ncbi:MAG: glycosyltransferase family 4 protein [Proteobacteria bacterium]|nr:glycosyltransferase family 4 protein [Pseudomonadota bacterium]MCP4919337.1 glycosyltransferase family 4 protein [Pseudomonadota bacterium]
MPLTVVQAAAFPFPSAQGSQVYVHGMSRALARRGHRVIVACYGHGEGEVDPLLEVVRTPRIPGYGSLRAGPDLVKPWLDLALAARLARIDADIVHAHNYEAPLAAYLARALRGTPVVYNNHNTMGEELHQYFSGRTARAIARRVGVALDRTVPRFADAAVAISEDAERILGELGCTDVTHIPPGVDMAELDGADPDRARREHDLGGRPWVVYAGNPDAYQDLEVLVDAVLQLEDVGLLMVSASPLDAWAERASALPPARKRFIRTSDWPAVRDLIAAADVAALPRTVCSGYPIKLLNYLGLGVPTVASAGSARDIAGVVRVPDHDTQAFAEAIQRLVDRPSMARQFGVDARQDVSSRFTWDACADRLERVYGRVLSRRNRQGG